MSTAIKSGMKSEMKPEISPTPDPFQALLSSLQTLPVPQALDLGIKIAQQAALPLINLFVLAERLTKAEQLESACELYRVWLAHTPSPIAYAAHFNMAVCLSSLDRNTEAEVAYRQAIAMKPDFIEAHLNLGTLMERLGRPNEAVALWNLVPSMGDPNTASDQALYVQAWNNLGRLLEIHKRYQEAEQMLKNSLLFDPTQTSALTHWVHLRQKQCEWPVYQPFGKVGEQQMRDATSALALLSGSNDPALQLAAARRFVADKVSIPEYTLAPKEGYRHHRLRVGYLSSDFCSHAVSILTAELYELHDRNKIDLYGFCWSREDGTPMRARVVKALDNYVPIHTLSDQQAAECIRQHEIDILVDLHGLTSGTRPGILAFRPAPVQITYLGFPGTTALPQVDYVIADRFVLPPELTPYFSEQPLYMPGCFQINDRQRLIGPPPTRSECGLPETGFVFCSFNNNFKFTPEMFATWMRILQRVPGSVLWMVADNEQVRENLKREAGSCGVAAARLIFAPRVSPAEYLARFTAADLFLDTLPFNAGTTASDVLWAGLPLLTCVGRTFAARMAGSILQAVDLPQLITYNLADYEEKAVQLAQQPEQIHQMKQQLVQNRLSCRLFDSPQFVRDLEAIYERIAIRSEQATDEMQPAAMQQIRDAEVYSEVYLFQIGNDAPMPGGYKRLEKPQNEHDDWHGYRQIRGFLSAGLAAGLQNNGLDETAYYGFFSAQFAEKTGLSYAQVLKFIRNAKPDTDVILFSPQPDMGAFFLNIFEQEELFRPGIIAASEAFLARVGLSLKIPALLMDSRQIVFNNYFVARPAFWRTWLEINEALFAICEGQATPLQQDLVFVGTEPGSVPRKVFLMEAIASLLLTLNPTWRVAAYNTFDCEWSASRLSQFKLEAVLSDALKIAMREQGFSDYADAFNQIRNRLR